MLLTWPLLICGLQSNDLAFQILGVIKDLHTLSSKFSHKRTHPWIRRKHWSVRITLQQKPFYRNNFKSIYIQFWVGWPHVTETRSQIPKILTVSLISFLSSILSRSHGVILLKIAIFSWLAQSPSSALFSPDHAPLFNILNHWFSMLLLICLPHHQM